MHLLSWFEEIMGALRGFDLSFHTLRGNVLAVKHDNLPGS